MKRRFTLLSLLFGLFVSPLSATVSTASLEPLREYSVILRDDLVRVGEVEGKTLVGGDLVFSQSANFGIRHNGASGSDGYLIIMGDVLNGNPLNVNSGSVFVGGDIMNNRKFNMNSGGSTYTLDHSAAFAAMFEQLDNAAAQLGLYTTSTVQFPGASDQPRAVTFNAIPDEYGTAYFSFVGADLFSNSKVQTINLNWGDATDVVFNVTGNVNWNTGSNMNWGDSSRVVWNFVDATVVDLGSHGIHGNILAPYAEVKGQNNINGSVYANSLNLSGEVHLPTYNGEIPIIPEPKTGFLSTLFAALVILTRKRRHQ